MFVPFISVTSLLSVTPLPGITTSALSHRLAQRHRHGSSAAASGLACAADVPRLQCTPALPGACTMCQQHSTPCWACIHDRSTPPISPSVIVQHIMWLQQAGRAPHVQGRWAPQNSWTPNPSNCNSLTRPQSDQVGHRTSCCTSPLLLYLLLYLRRTQCTCTLQAGLLPAGPRRRRQPDCVCLQRLARKSRRLQCACSV